MITITFPEWFAWVLIVLIGLKALSGILSSYSSWLRYRIAKLYRNEK